MKIKLNFELMIIGFLWELIIVVYSSNRIWAKIIKSLLNYMFRSERKPDINDLKIPVRHHGMAETDGSRYYLSCIKRKEAGPDATVILAYFW